MRYWLESKTEGGEPLRCEDCERPEVYCQTCPVAAGMVPHINEVALWYITLFQRCRAFSALPLGGGILDQSERTMAILSVIASEQAKHDRREERMREVRQAIGIRGLRRR